MKPCSPTTTAVPKDFIEPVKNFNLPGLKSHRVHNKSSRRLIIIEWFFKIYWVEVFEQATMQSSGTAGSGQQNVIRTDLVKVQCLPEWHFYVIVEKIFSIFLMAKIILHWLLCQKILPRNKMQENIRLLSPEPSSWFIDVIINNFRRPRRRC